MKFSAAILLFVLLHASVLFHALTAAEAADPVRTTGNIAPGRLMGRWIRPNGGYVLELKEISKDGTLKAAYFNPQPINVSRAELRHKDGSITLFIELRDVNYPGSNYNLRYDPKTDRLTGSYFQAVARETYDIEFVRTP